MSKPESIKVDPFLSFPSQPFSIFKNDFITSNAWTFKANAKGSRSTLNLKECLTCDPVKNTCKISNELKFWFDLPEGRSLFTKLKSGNYLKILFDNGIIDCPKTGKWNTYASLNSNQSVQNVKVNLGISRIGENRKNDIRIRYDQGSGQKGIWSLYKRVEMTHEKFYFSSYGGYDVTNKNRLQNAILLAYNLDKDTYLSFRAENPNDKSFDYKNWKTYYNNFTFDAVKKINSSFKVGVEFTVQPDKFDNAKIAVEKEFVEKKLTVKALLSSQKAISAVFKRPSWIFGEIAKLSCGVHASKLATKDVSPTINYGATIEFNL